MGGFADDQVQRRLARAHALAWAWHGRQTRKGRTTPYLSHLLQVEGLVLAHGGDPDQAIAALLHDGLEDAPDSAERAAREQTISSDFGAGVLRIVLDCTDTRPEECLDAKAPWRERKERALAQLAGADARSLLVAACDKRHNLGDLIADLREEGDATFDRFHAGAQAQLWYFEGLLEIFRPRVPPRLASELAALVEALREFVESGNEPPLLRT